LNKRTDKNKKYEVLFLIWGKGRGREGGARGGDCGIRIVIRGVPAYELENYRCCSIAEEREYKNVC
jgi:hypothetical protein